MIKRQKNLRPNFHLEQVIEPAEVSSVLDDIRPTPRTFTCRRNGRLVDGGYCAFFCELGQQQVRFDPKEGIDVICAFAYHQFMESMDDGAPIDS